MASSGKVWNKGLRVHLYTLFRLVENKLLGTFDEFSLNILRDIVKSNV